LFSSDSVYGARQKCYETIGNVTPFVMAPIVNPNLIGEEMWWPQKPAWRDITIKDDVYAYASDGLSDPFDDDVWRSIIE